MSLNGSAEGRKVLRGSAYVPDAIHGKSAYEIAVIHGFDGTEEEWLYSLAEEANTIAKEFADEAENFAKSAQSDAEGARQEAINSATAAMAAVSAQDASYANKESALEAKAGAESAEALAKEHAEDASASAMVAAESETNAKTSETNAKTSETNSKTSATNAKNSETNAKSYEVSASHAEANAKTSEANAKVSENNAKVSENNAKASEASASAHVTRASGYASEAGTYATEARTARDEAQEIADSIGVVQNTGDSETAVMSQSATTKLTNDIRANVSRNSKRITNLEQGLIPDPFYTDSSIAYSKDVPINALPYAEVSMIGGATYRSGGELISNPVTEVESVGVNLWGIGDVSGTQVAHRTLNLPAGTYTIGCLVTSSDTDATQSRVNFETAGSSKAVFFNRGVWESKTFTVNDAIISVAFSASTSNGLSGGDTFTFKDIAIYKGNVTLPYIPYEENTIPIPEAVQALDGYGEGNADNPSEYNSIEWDDNGVYYRKRGKNTNEAWVPLDTPETTDISDIITLDNLFSVEGGGTVTMVNEHGYAVPSEITYQIKGVTV